MALHALYTSASSSLCSFVFDKQNSKSPDIMALHALYARASSPELPVSLQSCLVLILLPLVVVSLDAVIT